MLTKVPQERVRLGQMLAGGALPLEQIGDRIEPKAIHALIQPEIDDPKHGPPHQRVVEIEIRLMCIEAMPVIGFRHGVPGPVGCLKERRAQPAQQLTKSQE